MYSMLLGKLAGERAGTGNGGGANNYTKPTSAVVQNTQPLLCLMSVGRHNHYEGITYCIRDTVSLFLFLYPPRLLSTAILQG
jgi:hypothetical protein